jgi:hypothetical protein
VIETEAAPEAAVALPPPGGTTAVAGGDRSDPGEALVFDIAAGVVVLHVLVAAFVYLEPGVSRADHLVPGLVPVVVLTLSAWLFPRVRPAWC